MRGSGHRFRQSTKWRHGDIVAVTTADDRHYIAYIHITTPRTVRLAWGNDEYQPMYFLRDALTVHGVIDL
jgi:uncharacterized protein YqfB (UPF0267 family)